MESTTVTTCATIVSKSKVLTGIDYVGGGDGVGHRDNLQCKKHGCCRDDLSILSVHEFCRLRRRV